MDHELKTSLLSLLPLVVMCLIIWAVVRVFRRRAGPETPGPGGQIPYGVRGALALFIYGSLYAGPILVAGKLVNQFADAERKNPVVLTLSTWKTYKIATWISTFVLLVICMWLAARMKAKFEPSSVQRMKAYLLCAPAVSVASDLALSMAIFPRLTLSADLVLPPLISGYIGAGVWFWYLSASKRVRNTYFGTAVNSAASETVSSVTSKNAESPVELALEDRLARLLRLHESGLIDDAEFARKKSELLATL